MNATTMIEDEENFEWVGNAEACRRLGVTSKTVYERMARGELTWRLNEEGKKVVLLPRLKRTDESHLIALIEQNQALVEQQMVLATKVLEFADRLMVAHDQLAQAERRGVEAECHRLKQRLQVLE